MKLCRPQLTKGKTMSAEIQTVTINDTEYRLDELSCEAQELFYLHMEAEKLRNEAARQATIHQAAVDALASVFTSTVLGDISDSEVDFDNTVTPIRK